jgi:hypothetical protein
MLLSDRLDENRLPAAERAIDYELVAGAEEPVCLGGLAVHLDLAVPDGFLRFGSRLEQAGHVQPDIQAG